MKLPKRRKIAIMWAYILIAIVVVGCGVFFSVSYRRTNVYMDTKKPDNVSCFGWEGDKDSPFIYMDGTFKVRDGKNVTVHFGVKGINSPIKWYLKEGFLPCFVSEYEKNGLKHSVATFADKVDIYGNSFVIAYSKMTTENTSDVVKILPSVSKELIPLGEYKNLVEAGKTIERNYAIAVDRFGGTYPFPSDSDIIRTGDFDFHYDNMKTYWLKRLQGITEIAELPDTRLIDAYKAGYIFTMIVKDGDELHVGENGYDRVFDHDIIGMLVSLMEVGDYLHFEEYSSHILDNVQYPDARWKYSYPFAVYLQKTGDIDLISRHFSEIKENTHAIATDRNENGIMKKTEAIDAKNYWLIDNWSALLGLTTYKYLCDELYKNQHSEEFSLESSWADVTYTSLKQSIEGVLNKTISDNNLNYLPTSMLEANDKNRTKAYNDANWAAHFLFGRWAWDGFLFGAEQKGIMLDMIDPTYSYGLGRLKENNYPEFTFGGFPGVSSAYNAGYGSAGLRGEDYRDIGIKSYVYMIERTQAAPYSWWECSLAYSDDKQWLDSYVKKGWGSCPHMWGQSVATKVLLNSLISEKKDGTLIIGRGIPGEWIREGERIAINNYQTASGRVGYELFAKDNSVTLKLYGSHGDISLELLALKGRKGRAVATDSNGETQECEFDEKNGIVTAGRDCVQITFSYLA